jgi:hypothetical protein
MAGISLSISANANSATATLQGFEKNALGLAKRIQVGFAERVGHRLFDGLMRAAAALPAAMRSAADAGGRLSDEMARTGAAGEGLVVLRRLFENSGIAGDRVVGTLSLMQKAIAGVNEENQSTATAFLELGLSLEQLRAMDPVAAFNAIGGAIQRINDPAQKAALAMRIFGRSGAEMIQVFAETNGMERAANELGGMPAMLAANATQLDAVSDRLAQMGTGWQQIGTAVAVGVLPALDQVTATIASLDLTGLGKGIGVVLSALVKLWPTLLGVGMAMAGMKVAALVTAFRQKVAAITAATAATNTHTAAANANAVAMTKQAGSAKLAIAAFGALAVAMVAAQVIMSREMAKAAALDAMVEGIDRGNAALQKFDIGLIQSTASTRLELAETVKQIQDERAAVQKAAEEQILRTESREAAKPCAKTSTPRWRSSTATQPSCAARPTSNSPRTRPNAKPQPPNSPTRSSWRNPPRSSARPSRNSAMPRARPSGAASTRCHSPSKSTSSTRPRSGCARHSAASWPTSPRAYRPPSWRAVSKAATRTATKPVTSPRSPSCSRWSKSAPNSSRG